RRDVLGGLEAQVVLEQDEIVQVDRAVAREQQRHVHRPFRQGGNRARTARVEVADDLPERDPVRPLETGEAEGSPGAFGRSTEDQLAGDRREVAERAESVPLRGLRRYREPVLILGG